MLNKMHAMMFTDNYSIKICKNKLLTVHSVKTFKSKEIKLWSGLKMKRKIALEWIAYMYLFKSFGSITFLYYMMSNRYNWSCSEVSMNTRECY